MSRTTLERRIAPGSDPGEDVTIQEWRPCRCQHCDLDAHWFEVAVMALDKAEGIVASHNAILKRI